jgi:thymus-specific serine protease
MMPRCTFLPVLLVIHCLSRGSTALRPFRAKDILNQQQQQLENGIFRDLPGGSDVETHFMAQPLDHFNSTPLPPDMSAGLFQRYFYSPRFVLQQEEQQQQAQYAFLCVGGEGPDMDESVLIDSVHCTGDMLELARLLYETQGASVHLFALEHRYYGQSYPYFYNRTSQQASSPTTDAHLQWLSSKQAQYDLRAFIAERNKSQERLTWITFGGSYPGMMAAWARKLHPDLVHAAVSSSAPVNMVLDFPGYLDRVAWDLQYERVGGSQQCLQIVMDGHVELSEAIQDTTRHAEVAELFQLCDVSSLKVPRNVAMFLGDGVVMVPAQSNDPVGINSTDSIAALCYDLTNADGTPMQALAAVSRQQNQGQCITLDWNATLDYIFNPRTGQDGGLRSWLWQTCTEFGFYQTCEKDSLCPFGRGYHGLDMDVQICQDCFGISGTDVAKNVEASHAFYGGYDIGVSRVLSVNGDVDPWAVLALTTEDGLPELPTHWVYGASHHYWTHPVQPWDDQEVQDARALIYLKVMEWLEEVNNTRQGPDMLDPNKSSAEEKIER